MELARSARLKTGRGATQGSVLSPILFNSVMDETANKIKAENKRPDMKTLILAVAVLIWRKDAQDMEEELNQWSLILKESVLKTDMDRMVPVRIKFTGTMFKQVDRSKQQSINRAYRPIVN
jgi:hypothetical protein